MKTTEARFWKNGLSKREWGYQFMLGSKFIGYGVVLFIGSTGWFNIICYKIVK